MYTNGVYILFFFFQAEDGIRYSSVTGVQTCALPIYGAADEERDAAAGGDFPDQSHGVVAELRGRVAPGRVDDVDEVVGHRSPLGDRRLRGADVHAAVDLRGIHADDLDRKVARQGRSQRALAAGGRAHEED